MFGRGTGRDALAAWLRRRARKASRFVALEEALLTGRFARYAAQRLLAFGLSRTWAIALHVAELTILAEVFGAKPFIASLALQNVTLVVDAWYWGALEALRRRLRELGPGSESSALTSRWMTLGLFAGAAVLLVPIGVAVKDWNDPDAPPMLHAYALLVSLRLAADVVLRTYYSGVFAFRRIHRTMWSVLAGPTFLVAITLVLWDALGGWSFVLAMLVSIVVSRGLLLLYTRRAYRRFRVPLPRWTLRPRGWPSLAMAKTAALAGTANLTTRLGAVVLLAALIPSLAADDPFEDPRTQAFAFALHLAAPMLFLASQWGFVFYHDWKRLERDEASVLARHLHGRLLVVAVLVGTVGWLGVVALTLRVLPWSDVGPTLLSLLASSIGLSLWTAAQLRGFARGEFVRQLTTAAAMIAIVWATLSATFAGPIAWYLALACGPWAAVALDALVARLGGAQATGLVTTVGAWARALRAARGPVQVWQASATRSDVVAARIAARLGSRGAVVRSGDHVAWFERPPFTARTEWLTTGGGAFASLARSEKMPHLTRVSKDASELGAVHARLFPEGFVLRVGRAAPARYRALDPEVRQAIWRDAVRAHRGMRGRSGWFVTCFAPDGPTEAVFAAPRPVDPARSEAWWRELEPASFRLAPTGAPPRTDDKGRRIEA